MATSKLDILINAKNNASAEIKTVNKDLGGLSGMAKTAAAGIGALGVAMAAVKAAQFAYELAKVSEEGQYLKTSFDEMARSVGSNADTMLTALRRASSGMISDVDLIRSANRAMMLGVADSADEMSALLEAATKRGRAMGLTTEQAFNDIVTGIGRMSPMILDNLGIVFDSEQVMAEYADTLGKTAEQLTQAEQKQALLNATIASTANMEMPVTSEFEQMTAQIENAKQALGEMFSPMVSAIISDIASDIKATTEEIRYIQDALNNFSIDKATRGMERSGIAIDKLRAEADRLRQELSKLENGTQEYYNKTLDLEDILEVIRLETLKYGDAAAIASQKTGDFINSLDRLRAMSYNAAKGVSTMSAAATTMAYDFTTAGADIPDWIYNETWLEKYQRGAFNAKTETRGFSSAMSELNSQMSNIQGKVSSVFSDILGDTAGVDADDLLPDAARLDENARRLADIAVGGFKGQDWMSKFAAEVPDIYQALIESGDPQAAAAQMLDDFQDGMLNGTGALIDREAAKERIKRMILGEQSTAAMATELAQEIATEMGVSLATAQAAAGASLGVGGSAGLGVGDTMLADLSESNVGGQIASTVAEQVEASSSVIEMSGKRAGRSWGAGFLEIVGDHIPEQLVKILAFEVGPLVQSQFEQSASLTDPVAP
jgi:hypothetical protein